jgi:threonine synthase
MKNTDIRNILDEKYRPEDSVILRYHPSGLSRLTEQDLLRVHISEGEKIFHLMRYRGIPIYILDETTLTETNTFEALLASVAIAHVKKSGRKKVIFSSGGNLGTALAAYAQNAGIDAYSFNPVENVNLLDGTVFRKKGVSLIGVRESQRIREIILAFRKKVKNALGYDPLIPKPSWRSEAFGFRGLYISEFIATHDIDFVTIAQTISAGFGPLGTFKTILNCSGAGSGKRVPAFLGVQQEANCYMFRRWTGKKVVDTSPLIVPTLFDRNPNASFGTYQAVAALLKETNGSLVTINQGELERYIPGKVMDRLVEKGVRHTARKGKILWRSGLMCLAGVMKAIDHGVINDGSALVCMTDGVRKYTVPPKPFMVVESENDLDKLAETFMGKE